MSKSYLFKYLGISQDSKVLFIYPHPDDETYCNAGLIQKLVHNNISVNVLCITKGEASTLSFSTNQTKLAETRQKEFESVMKYLGVTNYSIQNFGDGKLNEESTQVHKLISDCIEKIKPDFVFTYEPSGVYGHPDHVIVSKIITDISAFKQFKLLYTTVGKNYKSTKSSLKMAKDPNNVKPLEPNFQLRLTVKEYLKKLIALKMYNSQVSMKQEFFHKMYQAITMFSEYYVEKNSL